MVLRRSHPRHLWIAAPSVLGLAASYVSNSIGDPQHWQGVGCCLHWVSTISLCFTKSTNRQMGPLAKFKRDENAPATHPVARHDSKAFFKWASASTSLAVFVGHA